MDRGIIDIRRYLKASHGEGRGAFSVWGGEGERARFALPVWRSVFILGGERGGIFSLNPARNEECVPFFVLDMGRDPARTTFPRPPETMLAHEEAPAFFSGVGGGVLIFLGEEAGRKWFLGIDGGDDRGVAQGKRREELLFLAGECAGLLFFRDFAGQTD